APAQPVITQQPVSQVATNGATATFTVAVSGTGPFSYQWQLNGTNLNIISTVAIHGPSIPGATPASPMLSSPRAVAVDHAGNLLIANGDYYDAIVLSEDRNGAITTVAGVYGTFGYSGDGGPATNALMMVVDGVAVDGAGNLFIVDNVDKRIRRVDTNGIITTVAGNGTGGYFGDGGVATNAELNAPTSVTADSAGNLFIGDNVRVRKVNTSGTISTVAGNGIDGYSGDGGPAINAELSIFSGVGVDSAGSLLIADTLNNSIRKVDANGIITTVAGNGKQGYLGDGGWATNADMRYPYGVAGDGSGNLFIADTVNNCIRRVDASGVITTIAGNGTQGYSGDGGMATGAKLNNPYSVALDAAGNLF